MSDSLFSQKGPGQVPRGVEQQAVDANPSPQPARIGTPVWRSFVANEEFQKNNAAAIAAEQQQIRQSRRQAAESAQPIFRGAAGKLIRKVGRQVEELNPEEWADDPVAGPEARKSLWDREIRTLKKQAEDDSFQLRDPAFQAKSLSDKERQDMLAEGGVLQESDPRHAELKARLAADDEYRTTKQTLAQRAYDAERRARELEGVSPDEWWQSRTAPKPSEQRAAVVAEAQAKRAEAAAAENDAATRAREIDAELQGGVTGERSKELLAEKAEIAAGRGVIAEAAVKAEEPIKAVQEEAQQVKEKDFFRVGDTISGIWDAVKGLGVTAPAAFYQLVEGMERPDQYSESAKAAFAEADAYNREMQAKTAANQAAGTSSSVGEAFREAGGSLGFSLGSMAAAIPASIAGTAIGGPIGGVTAGMAASGTAAYRMAGASFLNEAFQTINAESVRKNGRPMNEQEMASAYEALLPIAKNTALWEAGPEAVGNAVTLSAGKIIFGLGKPLMTKFMATTGGKVATKVGAGAGALATELAGETITNVEQSADQKKADAIAKGQDPNAIQADWSSGAVVESFKEVAPQTLALMAMMGGAGAAIKGGAMAADKLRGGPAETETIAAELATIDPEAAPPAPEEVAAAEMIAPDAPAEGVLIERELAEIEAADQAMFDEARAAVQEAAATGDKTAIKAAEDAVENFTPAAPRIRAVLKIAAGKQLDDLTTAELNGIGMEETKAGLKPMKDRDLMIRAGADGSIILTDEALKAVESVSPRARARVKMTEAEALAKAKERTMSEWDVPMRDGTMQRVRANSPEMAEREAASVASVSGQAAVQVQPQATNEQDAQGSAQDQDQPQAQVPLPEVSVGETPPANIVAPGGVPAGAGDAQAQGEVAVAPPAPTDKESLTVAPDATANLSDRRRFSQEDTSMEAKVHSAIHSTQGADRRFDELRKTGATDTELLEVISQSIGSQGGSSIHGGFDYVGGKAPRVVESFLPEGQKRREVKGKELVKMVRDLMQIPEIASPTATRPKNVSQKPEKSDTTRATIRAKATIAKLKKNKRINIEETTGATQAFPGKIQVNTAEIINTALKRGMTDQQAGEYFDLMIDEEIRHLAQFDAAETLWKLSKSKQPLKEWREAHYSAIWQNDFVATGKADDVRNSYGMLDTGVRADWNTLADWKKAMEGIRIMSQTTPTENAKLWTNISDTLKQAIRAALASLKKFRTPALETEITNLENALRQLTDSSPDSKKPAPGKTGAGNRQPPKTRGDSQPSGDGETLPPRRDGARSPVVVGSRVEFERDGRTLTGVVTLKTDVGVRVRPDENPAMSFGVPIEGVRVIDSPAAPAPAAQTEKSATITFPSREKAQEFAKAWGRFSLRGHDLSSTKSDGTTSVTVYDVTPEERQWIDEQSAAPTGQSEGEVAQPTLDQLNELAASEGVEWVFDKNGYVSKPGFGAKWTAEEVSAMRERFKAAGIFTSNMKASGKIDDRLVSRFRAYDAGVQSDKTGNLSKLRDAIAKRDREAAEAKKKADQEAEKAKDAALLAEADQAALTWINKTFGNDFANATNKAGLADYLSGKVTKFDLYRVNRKWLPGLEKTGAINGEAVNMEAVRAAFNASKTPTLSEADQALLDAMEGLYTSPLTETFTTPVPPDRIAPLVTVATKYLAEGVNTPEGLAERLSALAGGKLRQFSQSIWFAFKMAGVDGVDRPDWGGIYSKDESRLPTDEGDSGAGVGGSAEVVEEAPKKVKRRRRNTGSRILDAFTNNPFVMAILQNGGMMSKARAKAEMGDEWWDLNGSQYDDAPVFKNPTFNVIYSKTSERTPNKLAEDISRAGLMPDGDVNRMWAELRKAADSASRVNVEIGKEIKKSERKFAQAQAFEAANQEQVSGVMGVQVGDQEEGMTFTIAGEEFTVESNDGETVVIRDGDKFGTQTLSVADAVWIDIAEDSDFLSQDDIDITAESIVDIAEAKGYASVDELAEAEPEAIQAEIQGALDESGSDGGTAGGGSQEASEDFALSTYQTDDERRAEEAAAKVKEEIRKRQEKRLIGEAGDLTADMFGGGETPLFNEVRSTPAKPKPLTTLNFLAGTPLAIDRMSMEEAVQERVNSIIPGWSGTVREARAGDPDTMLGVFDAGRNEIRINYDRFRYFRDELGLSETDVSNGVLTTLSHEIIHAAENDVLKEIYAAETGAKPAFDQWAKDYRKSVMDSMAKDAGLRNAAAAYVAKMPKAMQKDMLRDASRLSPEITRMFIEQQVLGKTSEEQSIKSRQGDAQSRPWLTFMDRTLGKIREWLGKSPSRPMADLIERTKKQLEKYRIKPEQIPDLPPFAAEAVAQAESARILGDLNAETLGEGARNITGLADVRSPDTVAKVRSAADQNGWAWPDVLEVIRKQLGLNDDFAKDGTELDKLIKAKRKDAAKLRDAGSITNINPPIIQQLNREIDRAKLVYGGLTDERLNRAILDAAWSFAGDSQALKRQDAMEFLTGTRPPKAKAGVNNIAAELKKWVEKNPVETVAEAPTQTLPDSPDPDETPAEAAERKRDELAEKRSKQLKMMFGPNFENMLNGARNLWKQEKEWRYNALLRLRENITTLLVGFSNSTQQAEVIATDMIEGKPTIIDKILAYEPIKESELTAIQSRPSAITTLGYERGDRGVYSHPKATTTPAKNSIEKQGTEWIVSNDKTDDTVTITKSIRDGFVAQSSGSAASSPGIDFNTAVAWADNYLKAAGKQKPKKPTPQNTAESAKAPQGPPSFETLEALELVRDFRGTWQYKMRVGGTWYTANDRDGAIEGAISAYKSTPEAERKTRQQLDAEADAAYDAKSDELFGGKSKAELEKQLSDITRDIAKLQSAGKSEFTGQGTRRTGAATSNEAARDLGEAKMRLERYLREKFSKDETLVNSLESAFAFLDSINAGTVTADQIKAAWQSFKDNERLIFSDLSKMTMKQLERFQGMRRPDNKAQAVRAALDFVTRGFNPNDSLSFQIIGDMKAAMLKAMDDAVATWTDERVAQKAQVFREARERRTKKMEDTKPEGALPAPRGYPSFQENEERWKKEAKEREASETAVETTDQIESFSPEQAASELAKRGITIEKGTTKTGKPVWEIKGKTFDVKDTLKSMGAKWYNPKKSWSIYSDEDPTTKIANALAGKSTEGASSAPAQNDAGAGRDADEELRLRELRERLDATPDGRGTRGDAIASVNADTAALIRKGLDFGMPPDVVEDQIEDIAMISRAFDAGKPMFLLGNGAGTGKTFVLGGAIRELRAKGTKSFVYVTMNQDLIEQIKNDLREYGVSDVSFHTYSELSTKGFGLPPDSVLIFDESHNVKNADSSRGSKTQPLMGRAKFTIIASATPFENPVEAAYLAGTGIFNEAGGHTEWGKAYGASVRKYKTMTPEGLKEFETLYWLNGKLEDGLAARQWFVRQGIMVTRPMRLPMEMVESQFSKRPAEAKWVKMYNEVEQAYESAMANYRDEDGNILDARNNSMVAMHMTNTIKRILEASKANHAVEDAKKILADGGNVVIFVETKADRWIGKYRASELYQKNSPLYTYPEMREMHREWEIEKNMAYKMGERPGPRPFAEAILEIARAMHDAGIMIELPSVEQELVEKLGGPDKVGVYTGSVTNAKARADKDAFLAGKKKVIVATMAKGGTGLSLHDKVGNRPTFQININLPWKATGVDQVSGRVARYGLQSKAFINWLFADNIPFERSLASRVGRRMRDMGALVKGIDMKAAKVLTDDFDFEGSADVKQDSGEVEVAEQDIFEQAERLEKSRRQRGDQSNGFFETPFPLAALMTRISGASGKLLDPSAGRGNLIRFAKEKAKSITTVELRQDNAAYLKEQGYNVANEDFMEWKAFRPSANYGDSGEMRFNTIHMNPPFERKAGVGWQDMAHVMKAFSLLTPGGRLVAIVGEGGFFRSDKQSQEFRQFLSDKGAVVIKLPEGAFKNSGTGVRTRMIVLDQNADAGRTDIDLSDMDADSLRSVADAIPSRDSEIGLQTSPLTSENAAFKKRINVDPELAANSKEQQDLFKKNVASGKLAGFGGRQSRLEQDIVDTLYEFEKPYKSNDDAARAARARLKENPEEIENQLLRAALGEEVGLDASSQLAFQYLINKRSAEAGNDAAKHAENAKLRMAYRLQRGDIARELQIGYDRSMSPEERAQAKLTEEIYKPSRKVQEYAKKLTGRKRLDYLAEESAKRIAEVETQLKKMGITLAQVTGKNQKLQLENTRLGKELLKTRNVMEADIIKAVRNGWTMPDIQRRWGKLGAEQAMPIIAKARQELYDRISAMSKSGMTREQILEKIKEGLATSPLGASNGMTSEEIWGMIENDLGIPATIPTTRPKSSKPKPQKSSAEMSAEEIAAAEQEAANKTAKAWLEKLAKSQSDTLSWAVKSKEDAMAALIRAHIKQAIPDFIQRAEALGADPRDAQIIDKEATEERRRIAGIKTFRANNAKEAADAKVAANNTPEAIANRWINKFAKSQSDTQSWGKGKKSDDVSKLIREHMKKPMADFIAKATALGMTEQQAKILAAETAREKAILEQIKESRKIAAKATSPFTADWSRPDFTDGLKSYTFDTKDREGIMERVEIIRGLAGAVGKIDALTGGQRTQALRKLQEINAILAKYGTDATEIFNSSQSIEDYRFDLNDIAQVAAVSRAISMMDADIVDKASEWLYFSMLSGLQTMLVNATAIVPAAWESTVGKGVEMAINSLVKNPMGAQIGEEKYVLRALGPALTRAMSNARTSFAAQHPMFDRDVMAQDVDWERIMGGKGYRVGGSISGKKGDLIRTPMRILAATDDFNTTLMACCEVGAFAYRVGVAKGMKPGSAELDKFIRQEVNTPGSYSYQLAAIRAKNAIFSNPLPGQQDPVTGKKVPVRDLGDAVGYVAGKITETFAKEHDNLFVKTFFAAMRISFFPFQRTPFNILRKGIRYTLNPFSMIDIALGIGRNVRNDGKWDWKITGDDAIAMERRIERANLVTRLGMQLQGGMLMLLVAGLGEGDEDDQEKPFVITGSAPFTPRGMAERQTAMDSGMGPYRISFRRADGSERFGFNYGRIEPMATTLAASIDIMKQIKRADRSGKDIEGIAGAALGGFVAQAQDKSFLRGVGDLISLATNAIAEPDLKENRKMQQFVAGRVAMAMPNIIKQPIREMDSNFRERSESFMEELLYQAIPAGQKPARVDAFGQTVEKVGNPAARIIDIGDTGTNKVNPIASMLLRYRDKHPDKAWFPSAIRSATYKHPRTGAEVEMTAEQLKEFRTLAGRRAAALLKSLRLNTENPTERDIEMVKKAFTDSRSAVKKALVAKYSR